MAVDLDSARTDRAEGSFRGFVAVAAGAVIASAGVGLLPHLLEGGRLLSAVMAPTAVIGGVVVLGRGAVRALRPRRWTGRIGGFVLVLVVVVVAAQVVVPAVVATQVPPTDIGTTPDDVGLTHEDVQLTTSDGAQLAAWYVPSRNGAAVVLRHGAGSTRSKVLPQAAMLAEHGYGVLLMDARGHGDSGGEAMDFGWFGTLDIAAGVDHLLGRADVDPARIGIVGSSMGGEEAIGAAGSIDAIRAVVADGATARTARDKDWYSEVFGLRGWIQERIEAGQDALTDMLTSASPPMSLRRAVASSASASFLLIAAGDVEDEQHAAAFLQAGRPDRVEVWTVAGVGHTGAVREIPEQWEARVIAFLDAHLR